MENKKVIDKNMNVGEILRVEPKLAGILMENGMHCLGCPSSQMESLEDACMVHGINSEELTGKLNDFLQDK